MDRKEIENVIQTFFNADYAHDVAKMATIFHKGSEFFEIDQDGSLIRKSGEAFVQGLPPSATDESGKVYPRVNEILSIDFTGENAAVARTKMRVRNTLYTDILCFMRLNGSWGIVAKIASGVPAE
jgi:hypothetical protein